MDIADIWGHPVKSSTTAVRKVSVLGIVAVSTLVGVGCSSSVDLPDDNAAADIAFETAGAADAASVDSTVELDEGTTTEVEGEANLDTVDSPTDVVYVGDLEHGDLASELAEGGDLNVVDCAYIDLGPDGVDIYRSSRNDFLGFDDDVVVGLRREFADLIEVGAIYGKDEAWVIGEIEKMHAHCLGLELPADADDPILVRTMNRLGVLANNPPDGTGSGAAGEGLDRANQDN